MISFFSKKRCRCWRHWRGGFPKARSFSGVRIRNLDKMRLFLIIRSLYAHYCERQMLEIKMGINWNGKNKVYTTWTFKESLSICIPRPFPKWIPQEPLKLCMVRRIAWYRRLAAEPCQIEWNTSISAKKRDINVYRRYSPVSLTSIELDNASAVCYPMHKIS